LNLTCCSGIKRALFFTELNARPLQVDFAE